MSDNLVVHIVFEDTSAPPQPNSVHIAFGRDALNPGAFFEIQWATGESFQSTITVPLTLGEVTAWHGESIGGQSRRVWKDVRLYPAVQALQNPFSLGLAFAANALQSWPAGYNLVGTTRHFLSGLDGIALTTAEPTSLVTPAWQNQAIFGGAEGDYPVYASTPGVLAVTCGESLASTLRLEWVGVSPALVCGEALGTAVATDRRMSIDSSAGEALGFDLAIESTVTTAATGESVVLTLDVYDLVGLPGFDGATLSTDLRTDMALPSSSSAGEQLTTALTAHPAAYMTVAFSHGESVVPADVKRQAVMAADLSASESFAVALDLPPRPGFEPRMSVGESFAMTVSFALHLGTVQAGEGPSLSIASLDEDPPYRHAVGESMSVAMVAYPNFAPRFHCGESYPPALTVKPGEGLTLHLGTGEWMVSASDVAKMQTFSMTFFQGVFIAPTESTATTEYDLAEPITYVESLGWPDAMNAWDFNGLAPSWKFNKGPGIVVKADLSIRPRFQIQFAAGESFGFKDMPDNQFVMDLAVGYVTPPSEFFYIEPRINLCYPNVFPSADNMEVELEFADESCYADCWYEGQSLHSKLATYMQGVMSLSCGERATAVLNVYPQPLYLFWHGQELICRLSTIDSMATKIQVGGALSITFEEPTVPFYEGVSITATLKTTIDVEFLEQGCLDNEYIHLTENGDRDLTKDTYGIAMELEPFAHDIKARCY